MTSIIWAILDFMFKILWNRTSNRKVIELQSSVKNASNIKLNNTKNGLKVIFLINNKQEFLKLNNKFSILLFTNQSEKGKDWVQSVFKKSQTLNWKPRNRTYNSDVKPTGKKWEYFHLGRVRKKPWTCHKAPNWTENRIPPKQSLKKIDKT